MTKDQSQPADSVCRAYLALGGNLGDRHGMLTRAASALSQSDRLVAVSPFYETPALVPDGAPDSWNIPFLNAVVSVDTIKTPGEMLATVKRIETELGRAPSERWAPRLIDIDILAMADAVVDRDDLTLPHPEAHKRLFVLEPWADLAPDFVHPLLGVTVATLLTRLRAS